MPGDGGMHRAEGADWVIPTAKDYIVRKPEYKSRDKESFNTEKVHSIVNDSVRPLTTQLRHKLQVRAKGRYEYGQKKGKLHNGSLHRLISSKNTEQEKRVFRKHVVSDVLDTAVMLLVDCSGSMMGSKFEMAAATAASVALALRPLNIPYCVLGFTTEFNDEQRNIINIMSGWGEHKNQTDLINNFAAEAARLWDNSDGDCIAWAYNNLIHRTETRKILLVMSDGMPSGRHSAGDCYGYTKKVIQSIEAGKQASIYGVGINDTSVRDLYAKHTVVTSLSSLAPAILSILDKEI